MNSMPISGSSAFQQKTCHCVLSLSPAVQWFNANKLGKRMMVLEISDQKGQAGPKSSFIGGGGKRFLHRFSEY